MISQLAFYALMLCFLSLWIHRSIWIWGGFLAISLILAFQSGIVEPFALIPLASLWGLFWLLKKPISGVSRMGLVLFVIALGFGLTYHIIPGFHRWHISGNFWVNYDKPFMGLFPLLFLIPLARSPDEWYKIGIKAVPLTLAAVVILMMLTLSSGTIGWHFKLPPSFIQRLAINFFLVVIPEEAFYRGFVQEELFKGFGQGLKGTIGSILLSAVLFALAHLSWTGSFAVIGFVFLAGIFYGAVYHCSKAVEGSIFCHFIVNFLHMTCFSYHPE